MQAATAQHCAAAAAARATTITNVYSYNHRGLPAARRHAPVDAFEQHGQLRRRQRHAAGTGLRPNEASAFQSLGQQHPGPGRRTTAPSRCRRVAHGRRSAAPGATAASLWSTVIHRRSWFALMPWRSVKPATEAPGLGACSTSQRRNVSAKMRLPLLMTRSTVGPVHSAVCPQSNIADTCWLASALSPQRSAGRTLTFPVTKQLPFAATLWPVRPKDFHPRIAHAGGQKNKGRTANRAAFLVSAAGITSPKQGL